MDEFQKKFLEEATDLIQELEESLLALEKSPEDQSLVEGVFRVMHSLKGGGAMFGFERISEFTHNLENLYDQVRNKKLKVTRELLDLTLESVDHIKVLLQKENEDREDVQNHHAELSSKILKLMQSTGQKEVSEAGPEPEQEQEKKQYTYHILFEPNAEMLKNGTNPFYLIDELSELGTLKTVIHTAKIPPFQKFEPKNCYVSWDIFLATSRGVNAIQDVFIFVEDESHIEIHTIGKSNYLENKGFQKVLNNVIQQGRHFTEQDFASLRQKESEEEEEAEREGAEQTKEQAAQQSNKENVISSIRVSSEKVDKLMNLVSELVTTQASLSLMAEETDSHKLVQISENVESLTRQLRDIAFSISLIPIESMVTRFQRLVRDLSSEFKKDINFKTEGTETELDKTLIQSLTEPIMHLLRNSIDHGVEPREERIKQGKPAKGNIQLKAFYSGTNVHIQIIDDGRGMDPQDIKNKAIERKLINPEDTFTEKEIYDLIFMPGFSTAKEITGVSGRGVGMDVVKRKINDIRGDVEVQSEVGKGTTVTVKLPLTLSIIDGLLVKIDSIHYVIPLNAVEKIYEASKEKIDKAFNNIIILDEKQVPFYNLRQEFDIKTEAPDVQQVVVVKFEGNTVGLAVDTVIGEYQAVLKSLGKHYKHQEIISGATILGDGTVALVLDTYKIIKEFSMQNQFKQEMI